MSNQVKPIPEWYHTVTPYLTVHDLPKLMEFLKQAFHAQALFQSERPDGTIGHAEMRIGDSMVMIGQARDQWTPRPMSLYLYVNDADATYQSAVQAGGKSLSEPKNQFYGDRSGGVEDPCGNHWWIATHVEDVSEEEVSRRMAAATSAQGA